MIVINTFVVLPVRDPEEKDFEEDRTQIWCRVIFRVLEDLSILSVTVLTYHFQQLYNHQVLYLFVLYFLLSITLIELLAFLFFWIYDKSCLLRISSAETSISDRIRFEPEVS